MALRMVAMSAFVSFCGGFFGGGRYGKGEGEDIVILWAIHVQFCPNGKRINYPWGWAALPLRWDSEGDEKIVRREDFKREQGWITSIIFFTNCNKRLNDLRVVIRLRERCVVMPFVGIVGSSFKERRHERFGRCCEVVMRNAFIELGERVDDFCIFMEYE